MYDYYLDYTGSFWGTNVATNFINYERKSYDGEINFQNGLKTYAGKNNTNCFIIQLL